MSAHIIIVGVSQVGTATLAGEYLFGALGTPLCISQEKPPNQIHPDGHFQKEVG